MAELERLQEEEPMEEIPEVPDSEGTAPEDEGDPREDE